MRAPPRGFSQLAASFIALRLHRHPPQTYISLDHIVLPSGTSAHRPCALLCQAPRARDSQPVPYPPYPLLCQRTITIDHPSPLHFVERDRVELSTPALSERCSNQLSYHSKIYEERRGEGKRAGIACRRHGRSPARTPRRISLSRRKEVIQPHLPVRLPCYDFTPLTGHTLESGPLAVSLPASGIPNSDGVTGGVYKARERIHRAVLMRDY